MIPGLAIDPASLTPYGLLVVFVLLIFTGWLVPYRTVKNLEKQLEYERKTSDKQRETNQVQAQALSKLTEVARTMEQVLGAIQRNARGD